MILSQAQIERPSPNLTICPICKQPSHLGCDHALIEFKADLREAERIRTRKSHAKSRSRPAGPPAETIEEFPAPIIEMESETEMVSDPVSALESRAAHVIRCAHFGGRPNERVLTAIKQVIDAWSALYDRLK